MFLRSIINQVPKCRHFSLAELTNVTCVNGVKRITMCQKKAGNCLSLAMMQNLTDNICSDWNNKDLRVIVIGAEGTLFSAGHNLKELNQEAGAENHRKVFAVASTLMKSIIDCPVPVIAAVNGFAVAAGCQLVAQCDLAVCTSQSKFSTPGVNVGIFCSTPGVAIARAVPKATALKMLFTGNFISAEEALQAGLVSHVCEQADFDRTMEELCQDISNKSRAVIELGKCFYYKQINENIGNAYNMAGKVMVDNLNIPDGIEGVNSFIAKRKPKWSH